MDDCSSAHPHVAVSRPDRRAFSRPAPPLRFPYAAATNPEWTAYALLAQERAVNLEISSMADLIYLALGVLFFALMGVYAEACRRL
jgi:hypothetical protein